MQHAYNPVDWYPWGEEALAKAKAEQKPILVSIGYAACHWCHVMERESFEDETVATFMNEAFINIKIDREERPDIDHIYMDAVQAMTGSGGWPLNVFLTPDLKPFFGGTYFPPTRAHNRASWIEVLRSVSKTFEEKRDDVETQADRLTAHLQQGNNIGIKPTSTDKRTAFFSPGTLHTIAEKLLEQADPHWGGFGRAPKFPQSFSILYLFRHYHATKNQFALDRALLSIDKMLLGGIYDQVGGGFSRYSVDDQWQVPHFEKMLYDNALLLIVLAEAFQITGTTMYRDAVVQTMDFLLREMQSPEGGFYSALDADSEGVEGKFYTWTKQELIDLLGADATAFCNYYQVSEMGNWSEGKHAVPATNILWLAAFPPKEQAEMIVRCKEKLIAARSKRIRPITDDKVLLGWNALMNQAICSAYVITGDESYKQLAESHMRFLEHTFCIDSTDWRHTYKNGEAKITAFLDDLSYLVTAYIKLQEINGDHTYLLKALSLTEYIIKHFSDSGTGFFYFTAEGQADVLVRKKEIYDGATPSGNAVMAYNLQYLSVAFDRPDLEERYKDMLVSLSGVLEKYPTSFGVWAGVLQGLVNGIQEIVVTGSQAKKSLYPILSVYQPHKLLLSAEAPVMDSPLLQGKLFPKNGALFYLCADKVCQPTFSSPEALLANM